MLTRTLAFTAVLTAAPFAPAYAQPAITVDPDRLTETVRTLASDVFEGRAPGTRGEERTLGYLIARFEALGLEPAGPDGGWLQKVPLLHTRLGTPAQLGFATPKGDIAPVMAQDTSDPMMRRASPKRRSCSSAMA